MDKPAKSARIASTTEPTTYIAQAAIWPRS